MKKKKKKRRTEGVLVYENHTWRSAPGYSIFVADRGAVKFEYPSGWYVKGDEDSIKLRDRKPPDDDCVLAISYMRLVPLDWSRLPLAELVEEVTNRSRRPIEAWDDVIARSHMDIDIAWRQGRYVDAKEQRRAITRLCLSRRGTVLPLLTMDFWESELERFAPIWDHVLDSLELDEFIADPRRGPRVM
jgi:hypothetical protein